MLRVLTIVHTGILHPRGGTTLYVCVNIVANRDIQLIHVGKEKGPVLVAEAWDTLYKAALEGEVTLGDQLHVRL